MNVSIIRLPGFFRRITDGIPDDMGAVKPEKGGISVGIYEIRSYTGKKKNRRRIWPASDRAAGQIAGFHIGGREREDARKLWKPLPGVYRRCAVCHTDFREAYEEVIPECRHRAAGKETGQTNHIGRTNCTLLRRLSSPVRKTLSFSKILDHHIRAIKYFIPILYLNYTLIASGI